MDNKRLKEALKERRIKQKEVAEALAVTDATVSQWISGKREPNDDTKQKLASLLGVSVEYLIGSTTSAPSLFHKPLNSKNGTDDTGNINGAGSIIGISPESERAIWLPVFNYSEITEDLSMEPIEEIPLSAARFSKYNRNNLFLVRQDIPFRQAAEGDIATDCLAIACKGFSFSNSKLYLIALKGRCLIRRVTKYADGSVDLSSDEGSKALTITEQTENGFKILARIIARVPDSIHFFE